MSSLQLRRMEGGARRGPSLRDGVPHLDLYSPDAGGGTDAWARSIMEQQDVLSSIDEPTETASARLAPWSYAHADIGKVTPADSQRKASSGSTAVTRCSSGELESEAENATPPCGSPGHKVEEEKAPPSPRKAQVRAQQRRRACQPESPRKKPWAAKQQQERLWQEEWRRQQYLEEEQQRRLYEQRRHSQQQAECPNSWFSPWCAQRNRLPSDAEVCVAFPSEASQESLSEADSQADSQDTLPEAGLEDPPSCTENVGISPTGISPTGFAAEHFDTIRTVGAGFMGSVHVVQFKSGDGTPFALKVMKKSHVIQARQVEHVMSERCVLSRLSHPFLVELVASFQDDRCLFMLMEYVNGGELFTHLRKCGRLAVDAARFYAAEIALGFEYMHGEDIAYRDLKPENVLLDSKGHARITDFGFAKVVRDKTWTLCGTPEYLAPEIINYAGHDKAVDWWAFGVLIYEMLTGVSPFFGESSLEIYRKAVEDEPHLPEWLCTDSRDIIRRLLAKDPAARLGNMASGAQDVKGHSWFEAVNWDLMLKKKYLAPMVPNVGSAGDTCMFDHHEEESDDDIPEILPHQQERFEGFSVNFSMGLSARLARINSWSSAPELQPL